MATATINLEIHPTAGGNSNDVYISGGEKRSDQVIPEQNPSSIDGLEASLTSEHEDCLEQFVETFLIEVYRCTICRSCFTQKSAIQSHIKLHNLSREIPSDTERTRQPLDPSLVFMPKPGLVQVAHDQVGNYHLTEKEKHAEKESADDKTCAAAAAISNALEVLVGLGTPTLTEGETVVAKVTAASYNREDKEYHQLSVHTCEDKNPSTVYNLSEVSLRLPDPNKDLKDLDQTEAKAGGSVVMLEPCHDIPTVQSMEEETVEIVLQSPSRDPSPSLIEHTDIHGTALQVIPERPPEGTEIEDLPGSKRATSIVLSHSSSQEQKGGMDINGLVRSASESNPEASIITVVTHRGGDKPLEMLQFKKSSKSDAIIPTAQSLGIISPFPKQVRTSKRKHSCPKCRARYVTEEELTNHVEKKHLRTNTFLCEICGLALATKASVKNHVLAKHSNTCEIYQCDQCEYQTRFEKHFRNHATKHTAEIWCRVCDQTFISAAKLKLHCQSPMHTNKVNPLCCPHCDYKTYKKDNLRVHLRKHTGQRPYQCIHCHYASADSSTLKVS